MNAPLSRLAINVRIADLTGESARIDGFVAAHPLGTIFHRPQWSRAVEQGCGQRACYLVAERGGALVGCLPLTQMRSRLFGNALVSAGFGTSGGILGDGAKALAEAAAAMGFPSIELRGGPIPEGWDAQSGTYANFARDLPGDEEALLAAIPRRQRAEVRRSLGFDLQTSIGRDRRHRDAHYRVYATSVRNLGTPVFPRRLFEAMLDGFGDTAEILIVWHGDEPLAALLSFHDRGICQPYWGGGTFAAREWRANDLVYFDLMRRAIARGCTRADFGRSKIGTGAHARKRIWGFDEEALTYATLGEVRETNPLDPKYQRKVALWQKLPLPVANLVGPLIARGLG